MACPHVSGVVALLYSKGITNPYAIKDRIQTKAYDLGEVGKDNEYGYGRINAYAALNELNPDVRSVKVFACDSNDLIVGTPRNPDSLGNYALSDLPAGTWTICAFYDKDLNGLVNASDQFAFTTEPVTVLIGRTTQGVNLELMEITGLSTSMSLEEYVRSTIK